MKFSYTVLPLLALGVSAAPSTAIEARNASPINAGAISLIESLEGFRADFYYINGHETIGYGHDCVESGGCGSLHPPISQAEGTALFKKDIAEYESCVCAMANAKDLNANQYGALVSFAYNSGCGGVQSWWHGAMAKKNFKGICEALPTTNTLGGELSSRRKKEGAFCSKATTAKSGCA
ncbi:glycoside hydrolase family 24 protein [Oidiodendron maius Zn]|uniref:Glycoside hydrolase family 24 protein n=1 Tax=Oidiodendron maius (strain Zn) TaxID=913774 RepID=A0A0C3C8G4_OIDMZ|nr:glycoside hydrolase family 24 protein [Oidiodendron maius Zn]